ncbi:MAG: hypothetical protein ACR2LT_02910, partial [Pyrinomonadaceae bacterium]
VEERKIENPSIERLHDKNVDAILTAFFTFTPFIKSEIFLSLVAFFAKTCAKIGIKTVKQKASDLLEIVTWVEKEASERDLLYN